MQTRQSNIELLRLLSMLMIVIFHFNGHALESGEILSSQWVAYNLTHTLMITATSVFVLISGYFGIRFKVKGVLKLYLRCFIWGLVGYLLYAVFTDNSLKLTTLAACIMPFTHNKWWFIITYLELYFLSPVLNAAIEMFDKKKHMLFILLFGFVTLYMGYCRETGEDTWGTSLSHFLWLYMIARYINKYVSHYVIQKHRWVWAAGFIVSSLITFGLAALGAKVSIPVCLRAYPYCSPWVLMGALSLLLFALSFTFESRVINWFASSSLSAYLLQDSIYFAFGVVYPLAAVHLMSYTLPMRYVLLIGISIAWLMGTCITDKLWNVAIYEPIMLVYDYVYEKFIPNSLKLKM